MVIANFAHYENTRFRPGVGSHCVREYKKCMVSFDFNLCSTLLHDCGSVSSDNYGTFIHPTEDISILVEMPPIQETFTASENSLNKNLCFQTAGLSKKLCENLCFKSQFSRFEDDKLVLKNVLSDHYYKVISN